MIHKYYAPYWLPDADADVVQIYPFGDARHARGLDEALILVRGGTTMQGTEHHNVSRSQTIRTRKSDDISLISSLFLLGFSLLAVCTSESLSVGCCSIIVLFLTLLDITIYSGSRLPLNINASKESL